MGSGDWNAELLDNARSGQEVTTGMNEREFVQVTPVTESGRDLGNGIGPSVRAEEISDNLVGRKPITDRVLNDSSVTTRQAWGRCRCSSCHSGSPYLIGKAAIDAVFVKLADASRVVAATEFDNANDVAGRVNQEGVGELLATPRVSQ